MIRRQGCRVVVEASCLEGCVEACLLDRQGEGSSVNTASIFLLRSYRFSAGAVL